MGGIALVSNTQLKQEAKAVIRRDPRQVYLVAGAVIVALMLVSYLYGRLLGLDDWMLNSYDALMAGATELPPLPRPAVSALVVAALVYLASVGVSLSFRAWCLRRARGEEVGLRDLFPEFGVLGKAVVLQLIINALVALGIALFLVPGIWLAYRWRHALYILFDAPELSVFACLARSGAQMAGRKLALFSLELSFLGWLLLASFMSSLYFPVFDIWLRPYMELAQVEFYLHTVEVQHEEPGL